MKSAINLLVITSILHFALPRFARVEAVQQKERAVIKTVRLPIPPEQKVSVKEIKGGPMFGYGSSFRLLKSSAGDELAITAGRKCCEYYAVSLDGKFVVRTITQKAWEGGERVKEFKSLTNGYPAGEGIKVEKDRIEYQGKSFAKRGRAGAWAYVSQKGSWMAVVGYGYKRDGLLNLPPIHGGGGGPETGAEYLSLYDLSSGQKMLPGTIKRSKFKRGNALSDLVWIDDRYLIVPEEGMQSFLLVILPNK